MISLLQVFSLFEGAAALKAAAEDPGEGELHRVGAYGKNNLLIMTKSKLCENAFPT